jgi:hypothetical protein
MSARRLEPEKGEASLLSNAPTTRRELHSAIGLMAVYLVLILALVPWSALPGPSLPQSVAVFTTGIIVAELATAFLLISQIKGEPDWSVLLISCAYLFSGLMGIAHVLTFPGAVVPDRPAFGGIQLTSYVFNGWRLGFAALMLCGVMVLQRKQIAIPSWHRVVGFSLYAVTGIVSLGFVIGVVAEDHLPIVVAAGQFTTAGLLLSWAAVAVGALALSLLAIKTRGRQVLYLWVMLAMATFCGDLFLSTFSGGRFTLGWSRRGQAGSFQVARSSSSS